MSGFVSEENILLNQQATTKEEALRTISDAAARLGVADDADAVYAAFLAREEIDKTGMVDGFAVPHCKTDAVKSALEAYVTSEQQSMEHYLEDQYQIAKAATVTVAPTGEVILVCAENHDTLLTNIEKALAA